MEVIGWWAAFIIFAVLLEMLITGKLTKSDRSPSVTYSPPPPPPPPAPGSVARHWHDDPSPVFITERSFNNAFAMKTRADRDKLVESTMIQLKCSRVEAMELLLSELRREITRYD